MALISYWNYFSPIPFGKCAFLEVSYKQIKKVKNFENFESTLYMKSGIIPLIIICTDYLTISNDSEPM